MSGKWSEPEQIARELQQGVQFKMNLCTRGLYEQNRMNERFFVGDQWHGAKCGQDRPLLMHNIIKRIGDYKMSVVGAASLSVNYSADGIPYTVTDKERVQQERDLLAQGEADGSDLSDSERVNLIMGALSDYFRVTAERLKFDDQKTAVLKNAYIGGTGVLYTYWDERVQTGLYADEGRTAAISGDIRTEVLPIENVYFGDPNLDDIQEQPYILITRRRLLCDIRRDMRKNRRSIHMDELQPDEERGYEAGDRSQQEGTETKKATVTLKLYKEWSEDGGSYRVMATEVCGKVTVRAPYDTGLRLYPVAIMRWETRQNCAYGDSEITHLIPNQIAINRANTAAAWAVMISGVPITVVNGDIVTEGITNDPGQIIRVYGSGQDVQNAIHHVAPPAFSPAFDNLINGLINNTLTQSGANDAALGDMNPDNTSAIIAVREAATMPMQMLQNRFYSFVEDVARIWAEFWVQKYGKRQLRISDKNGDWYLPFNGDQYKNLLINTKVDVGAAGIWSESQTLRTLDNLLTAQIISPIQYLERMPKGVVPDLNGLLRDYRAQAQQLQEGSQYLAPSKTPGAFSGAGANYGAQAAQAQQPAQEAQPQPEDGGAGDPYSVIAQLPAEYQAQFAAMTPEQQAAVLQQMQA